LTHQRWNFWAIINCLFIYSWKIA